MSHYPNLLTLYGPLVPISTLKSERNHRRGKIYAKNCNSRIDFAFSSAVNFQLILCERLLRVDNTAQLVYNKVTRARVQTLLNYEHFSDILPRGLEFVETVNSVTVSGTLYTEKMVVVLNVDQLFPVFGRILHIVLSEGSVAFVVRQLITTAYDSHNCSYPVEDSQDYVWVQQKELLFFTPLWQRRSSGDGRMAVCLKHSL